MKKSLIVLIILGLAAGLAASSGSIKLGNDPTAAKLTRSGEDGLSVGYSIDKLDYSEVQTTQGVFTDLSVAQYTTTNVTGLPRLPLLRQIISVPEGAQVVADLGSTLRTTIKLGDEGLSHPLLPRQESVSKSADPAMIPFVVDSDFYNRDAWTRDPSISVTELGHVRGRRLFALDFMPVSYNPVRGEIEVIYNAEVNVQFINPDHFATEKLLASTWSPAFEGSLRGILLNPQPERISLNRHPMGYLIITPENFVNALLPFVNWKTREGYRVTVATAPAGISPGQIKAFIQNIWDSSTEENPAPSYLLIVGDTPQIPANTGITDPSHVTDLHYVRLQGTDYMPEMYFGRFPATTEAEVTNQVNKTLMHEMYSMPDDSYLAEAVMIAGADATFSTTHANGHINYGTNNYFNPAHGINSHTYLYPESQTSDAAIVADVSAGVGYVNYTAHGNQTSWGDPTFTIANVNSLANVNESSVVVGNCCLTSAFNTPTCFAEAWLRAPNKGGVVYIGGTNSTYWDEDYWWGVGWKPPVVGSGSPFVPGRTGAYDAMFHDHNEPFEDWAGNVGSATFMGNMAVVQSNSSRINYYWEIYSIMGDPSLIPYLGIPQENSFEAPQSVFMGTSSLQIVADPHSYVAISMNDELHGAGLTDASGSLTLNFAPLTGTGPAQMVVTRSLRKPVIADIELIPSSGPYVTVSSVAVNDPNSNGLPEAGETISMDLSFSNIGTQPAANLTATLASECEDVSIIQASGTLPNIPAGGTIERNGLFRVLIHITAPDQLNVPFQITVSDGTSQWMSTSSITVFAPNLRISDPVLSDQDGDGFFEPGESILVELDVINSGHLPVPGGTLTVVADHPHLTISATSFPVPPLAEEGHTPISFTVTLDQNAQSGQTIPIGLAYSCGLYNANSCILLAIGVTGDGFESGGFTAYPWMNSSFIPWTLETAASNVHTGNYSARSGTISHDSSTELTLTLNIESPGNVSFWRKVSSENNYDLLTFSIDGIVKDSWSGIRSWEPFSYPVNTGIHTFKWAYIKDEYVSYGNDCAWIDDIFFPAPGSVDLALIHVPQQAIKFLNVKPHDALAADFVINNLGTLPLSGTITYPVGMQLLHNGSQLPNGQAYTVPVGAGRTFTLTFTAPDPVVNLSLEIVITSNDPNNPTVVIPVVVSNTVSSDDPGSIPLVTELEGNYPNPFNPETTISFSTRQAGPVRLSIYNLKGQLVRDLVDGSLPAGQHRMVWNGRDQSERSVSSGIYLYRMVAPGYERTLKMMLMK